MFDKVWEVNIWASVGNRINRGKCVFFLVAYDLRQLFLAPTVKDPAVNEPPIFGWGWLIINLPLDGKRADEAVAIDPGRWVDPCRMRFASLGVWCFFRSPLPPQIKKARCL